VTAAAAPAPGPSDVRSLVLGAPGWMRHHLLPAVLAAAAGGITAYVVNVWIMAVRYDGYFVPSGAPVTGEGNIAWGTLFWAVATAVALGVIGYWRAVGNRQFWADVRGLPRAIGSLVRADGAAVRVHLLWGAATGLVATLVLPPALGAVTAIGIVASAPTMLGSMLSGVASRAWSGIIRPLAPQARATGVDGVTVSILGGCAALALGFVVTDDVTTLVLAAGCAVLALVLARRSGPSTPVVLLLVVVGAGLLLVLGAEAAWADDGGFIECGQSWSEWLRQCQGSGTLRRYAAAGAVAGAVGGAGGLYLGDTAGRLRGRARRSAEDLRRGDNAAIRAWVGNLINDPAFQQWRAAHPQYTGQCSGGEFNSYMIWRHTRGLADPALVLPSQRHVPDAEATEIDDRPPSSDMEARASAPSPPSDENGPLGPVIDPRLVTNFANARGEIFDMNGYHIANTDVDGNVTDLDGNPVLLWSFPDGNLYGYERDGHKFVVDTFTGEVSDADGMVLSPLPDAPTPDRYPGDSGQRSLAQYLRTGGNGEIYGADGAEIARLGPDGVIRTPDGKVVQSVGAPRDGQIPWYRTEDGQTFDSSGRPVDPNAATGPSTQDLLELAARPPAPTPEGPDLRMWGSDAPDAVAAREALMAARRAAHDARVRAVLATPTVAGLSPEGQPGQEGRPGLEGGVGLEGEMGDEGGGVSVKTTAQLPKPPAAGGDGLPSGPGTPSGDGTSSGEGPQRGEGTPAGEGGDASLPAVTPQGESAPVLASEGTTTPEVAGEGQTQPATTGDGEIRPATTGDPESGPVITGDGDRGLVATEPPGHTWKPIPGASGDESSSRIGTLDAANATLKDVYARAGDVKSFEDAYRYYVGEGYDERLAATMAATEVGGAYAADESKPFGGVGTELGMLGGAMLPDGIQSAVLPGKVVENYVRTGVDAWSTVAQTAGASWDSGELDLSAFDELGRRIEARDGTDPFKGYSQVAGLMADEYYRDDGQTLVDDLGRITAEDYTTALGQSAEEFRQAVANNEYGSVLRGINDVFDVTSQVIVDPGATVKGFFDDCIQIGWNGVGDGYWTEVGQQVDQTLKTTPVVDTIYDGYKQVIGGIAEHAEGDNIVVKTVSGVGGFAAEMVDGGAAFAAETYDWLHGTDSAKKAYDYVRSWF
jgi:hypothetical protein